MRSRRAAASGWSVGDGHSDHGDHGPDVAAGGGVRRSREATRIQRFYLLVTVGRWTVQGKSWSTVDTLAMIMGAAAVVALATVSYSLLMARVVGPRAKHTSTISAVLGAVDDRAIPQGRQLRGGSGGLVQLPIDGKRQKMNKQKNEAPAPESKPFLLGEAIVPVAATHPMNRDIKEEAAGANPGQLGNGGLGSTESPTKGKGTRQYAEEEAAEDSLEEATIKEVLEEWRPREGHDADDEQRFRKFKHGERIDVVHDKNRVSRQLQQHPMKGLTNPVRGVRPSEQKRYGYVTAHAVAEFPTPASVFRCNHGKGKDLPLSVINDDFCDCTDGSDEPGTSACSNGLSEDKGGGHGVFYCGWNEGSDSEARDMGLDEILFPSQVNDGVCDCCNGADEFLHVGGLQCLDKCRDALRKRDAKKHLFNKGKTLRQHRYAGKSRDTVRYGKDGAYFLLSQRCFKTTFGNYVYDICPFHSVKQTERGRGRAVELGKGKGRWVNPYLLVMNQGTYCAGHGARKTEFQMECGTEDLVKAVEEFETCVYRVVLSTPAACF